MCLTSRDQTGVSIRGRQLLQVRACAALVDGRRQAKRVASVSACAPRLAARLGFAVVSLALALLLLRLARRCRGLQRRFSNAQVLAHHHVVGVVLLPSHPPMSMPLLPHTATRTPPPAHRTQSAGSDAEAKPAVEEEAQLQREQAGGTRSTPHTPSHLEQHKLPQPLPLPPQGWHVAAMWLQCYCNVALWPDIALAHCSRPHTHRSSCAATPPHQLASCASRHPAAP